MLIEKTYGTALVALYGAPGDHLHALPALRQFRHKCNKLILNAYWRGGLVEAVYKNLKTVDQFIWLDQNQMKGWGDSQIGEYLLQQLGGEHIDHYVNLNGYTGMMSSSVEWDNQPIEEMREYQDRHRIYDRYCDILGVPEVKGSRPKLKFSDEEIEWADKYYGMLEADKLVGWQWSGSAKVKEHPNPQDVIRNLLNDHDIKIVTIGSERFADIKIPGVENLAGKIKWRQAALLTSYMDLFISPDTSIMVAAQGFKDVPKILLATTTSGKQIAFPETTIIQSTAECSPCYRVVDTCDQDDCCGKIEGIYQAADYILRS